MYAYKQLFSSHKANFVLRKKGGVDCCMQKPEYVRKSWQFHVVNLQI